MDNIRCTDFNIKLSRLNVQLEPIVINPMDLKMDITLTPINVELKKFPDIKISEIKID